MPMRWILACVVCLIVALIWEQWFGAARPAPGLGAQDRAGDRPVAGSEAVLEAARGAPRAELPAPAEVAPEPAEPEDLVALLRRVALAYAAQGAVAPGPSLPGLVRKPARCEQALLPLAQGGPAGDGPAAGRGGVALRGRASRQPRPTD